MANLLEPTPFAPQGKCGVSPALTDFEWTAGIPAVKEGGTANDTLVPLYGTKVFFANIPSHPVSNRRPNFQRIEEEPLWQKKKNL